MKGRIMAIEKILFPSRFRELAYESLETLFPLKNAGLKEVILCHVISREDVGFVPFGGYLKEEANKLREEAVIRFADWQKSLSERGISSKVIVNVGETVHEILKAAEAEKVDLLVIGRKKRVDGTATFIGSYAHKIITRSKFPTLVSKYMVQYNDQDATLTKINRAPFEMPLFAADWTERSGRVLDVIASLKGVIRKVFLFYNIDERTLGKSAETEIDSLRESIAEKLQGYCDRLKADGIKAEPHVGAGGMLDEIIRVSRERKASMIIVGNTSKDRLLSNILDRSLSYQVSKMSELPTLLVP
jgi:nucleotide-binding universal stress UspA family protein